MCKLRKTDGAEMYDGVRIDVRSGYIIKAAAFVRRVAQDVNRLPQLLLQMQSYCARIRQQVVGKLQTNLQKGRM